MDYASKEDLVKDVPSTSFFFHSFSLLILSLFFFFTGKHHEWHLFSSGAVLGNSIASLKAAGFVVHFSAYICVAPGLIGSERPCYLDTGDGSALGKKLFGAEQIAPILHSASPSLVKGPAFGGYDVISGVNIGELDPCGDFVSTKASLPG